MNSQQKLRVGVIMGGMSGEHEVSVVSADSVMRALDKNKYEVIPIGITKKGKWISGPETVKILKQGMFNPKLAEKIILPDPTQKSLMSISQNRITKDTGLDVVFPLIHGTYGEDGKLQGLLEMANIPYVGCGVLGSAVGMDKIVMKNLFIQSGLKTVKFSYFIKKDWLNSQSRIIDKIEKELDYPIFVKPANLGSSVGIHKAKDQNELIKAIIDAVKYDRRVIVEEAVVDGREIECAVLGNDEPRASVPGEIIPKLEFYSYEAKYVDEKGADLEVPARLKEEQVKKIQAMSIKAFKALDLAGMARVDFLIDQKGQIFISEVNSVPGFTKISMYPKLWEASDLPYEKLLDRLIELAMERHQEKNVLVTSFDDISSEWQENY